MNWASIETWAMTPGGIAVWLTLLCGLFFGSLLISVDRKIRLGREAALIALLAAVASASRVLFAALPNVQPVTLFILMIGLHLGARRATAVAMLTALLSNMALGHGPWTFYQAIAWAAVGTSSAVLRPLLVNWAPRFASCRWRFWHLHGASCSIGWYLCQHWPFTNRLKRSSHSSLQV